MSPQLNLCGGKKYDFRRRFRVKENGLHWFPISDVLRPPVRVLLASLLVEFSAAVQKGFLSAEMAVIRGDEANAAV